MLIKHKLVLNTGISIVSLMLMLGLLSFAVTSLENNINVARELGEVQSYILQLRRHEKDFIARKDMKYVEEYHKHKRVLESDISMLEENFDKLGIKVNEIQSLRSSLKLYYEKFDQVVESQQAIGLHPKDGLYGALRGAVHNVEDLIGKSDFKLLSSMLQLRRNEKDFMLRLDEKYVDRLVNNTATLIVDVGTSSFDSDTKQQIVLFLEEYERAFLNLVKEQRLLGLSHWWIVVAARSAVKYSSLLPSTFPCPPIIKPNKK